MREMTTRQRLESALARGLLGLPGGLLRLLAGPAVVKDDQTLDLQCQLMLRMQRLRGMDGLGGRAVAAERELMADQSRILAPGARRPMTVRAITVAGAQTPIAARSYRPDGLQQETDAPALVYYHGGGFTIGSLDSHDGVCRALAERAGCMVISVDYRLAPEHRLPAAVDDAVAAFRDIAGRAGEFGIDARRIAVSGDSAGGNLAAVVCQQLRGDAVTPCFQLLFYPVIDFARDHDSVRSFARGFLLEKSSMDWFRSHYIPAAFDTRDPRLSPLYGDLEGLPPALVVTGGFDPLRDEGEAYADALAQAGVTVSRRRHAGLIHGFLNFAGAVKAADSALTQAAGDLAAAFSR